jgi:hypothetical protein
MSQYRHWPRLILDTTKSMQVEQNIWL